MKKIVIFGKEFYILSEEERSKMANSMRKLHYCITSEFENMRLTYERFTEMSDLVYDVSGVVCTKPDC